MENYVIFPRALKLTARHHMTYGMLYHSQQISLFPQTFLTLFHSFLALFHEGRVGPVESSLISPRNFSHMRNGKTLVKVALHIITQQRQKQSELQGCPQLIKVQGYETKVCLATDKIGQFQRVATEFQVMGENIASWSQALLLSQVDSYFSPKRQQRDYKRCIHGNLSL